jgi:hypothetical protein
MDATMMKCRQALRNGDVLGTGAGLEI